ncbi:MAG: M6 family metalloprotease domain-containing protein, partial [Bacteroidales bacterium]|nr:M6 family metalloprotease domain-containing protein [Candidatus Sodaliphilus aphodohippi]
MKKLTIIMMALVLATLVAKAVPAIPTPITYQQSDGTTITVSLVGDERHSTFFTLDGYALSQDANGDFYYQTSLGVSRVMAHNQGQRQASENAFVAASAITMQQFAQVNANEIQKAHSRRATKRRAAQVPPIGRAHIPVIIANFTDIKFKNSNPVSQFTEHYCSGDNSVRKYFEDQSFGKFSPQIDVLGPVNLPHERAFYGRNSGSTKDINLGQLVVDAVKELPDTDFSPYDNDSDGYADVVIVLYAGVGEAQGGSTSSVWPCQWDLYSASQMGMSDTGIFEHNGAKIYKFAVFNELSGSRDSGTSIDGIGTFCHEFSHCLGLPDFYDTQYGGHYGMGSWSIMCSGNYNNNSNTPAGYTAYERSALGWMDLTEGVANTYYTLDGLDKTTAQAIKITNREDPNEYYILENHSKTGWYAYNKASGLMILHVTYNASRWSQNAVNNYDVQGMTFFPADNRLSTSNENYDLFPYSTRNSLTDKTTPAATLNNSTSGFMSKPITDISKSNNKVSFWFWKGFEKTMPVLHEVSEPDITINSFTAHWDASKNTDSYAINIIGPDGSSRIYDNLTTTEYTAKNLETGATYSCAVKAKYSDGNYGEWSDTVTVTLKSNPVLMKADSITSSSFKASWNKLDNVESYTLHIRRDGFQNYTELMHETFAKCVKSSSTNIASKLANYTDISGWRGTYLYQNVGGIKIGSSAQTGTLISPKYDFNQYNGKIVVKFKANTVGDAQNKELAIAADGNSQKVVVADSTETEYSLTFMTSGALQQSVTFSAGAGANN